LRDAQQPRKICSSSQSIFLSRDRFDIERNKSKKRRAEKAERLSKTVGIEKRRNTTCTRHRIST
jgi:hypothetical protein